MRRARLVVGLSGLAVMSAACSSSSVADAPAAVSAPVTAPATDTTPTADTPTPTPAPTGRPDPAGPTSLPDPSTLPRSGSGEFTRVAADGFHVEGSPMIEFSIAVENGTAVDVDELADFVIATLSDERGWVGRGAGFRIVTQGGLFTLVVATPDTVDRLCLPLKTLGRYSCARNGWIALNLIRWETATEDWPTDLETYRRYLVNHEIGHYIVGPDHESCPGPGAIAPVMMQQTKGLDGCIANGWVDP